MTRCASNVSLVASVLVLFGGTSAEHEVSCVSAASVVSALQTHHHHVVAVGIDRSGGWHLADVGSQIGGEAAESSRLEPAGEVVHMLTPGGRLVTETGSEIVVDAAFPVLHGPFGEDGTVQGLLEVAGLPYVGAGVLGSAVGMDKDIARRLLAEAGLPLARSAVVRKGDWMSDSGEIADRLSQQLGFPAFVKPASLGSSVGISKVEDDQQLAAALSLAFEHGPKAVVEEAVVGREIEVAVLDGPRMSVPGEIVPPPGHWYDYESKYQDEATVLHVPAQLSATEIAAVQALAGLAFETLDLTGLARVDFFYEEAGRGFLVNEVNTMPGMTSRSMFPLLWEASGLKYPDLIDGLVKAAIG